MDRGFFVYGKQKLMIGRRQFRRVAGAILVATACLMGQAPSQAAPVPTPPSVPRLLNEGETAPDFTQKGRDGNTITLSELTRKKTVLLVFFFLASDLCRVELPHLQRAYDQHRESGLEVVAVNIAAGASPDRYWSANHLSLPVMPSGAGKEDLCKAYLCSNFPTHYLIGKDRKILSRWVGFLPDTGPERLKQELARGGFK